MTVDQLKHFRLTHRNRWQASSHRFCGVSGFYEPPQLVGASMLAMVVNDDAGCLLPRGVLMSIASKLAPTVDN